MGAKEPATSMGVEHFLLKKIAHKPYRQFEHDAEKKISAPNFYFELLSINLQCPIQNN